MQRLILIGSWASLVMLGYVFADKSPESRVGLKSGPEVGESIPGAFHPLNVTGPGAGSRVCQI
jgi:hypothetical protein